MILITKGKTLNKANKRKTKVSITCYKCGEEGHLATNCPSTPKQEKMNGPLNHEEHSASGNQLYCKGYRTVWIHTASIPMVLLKDMGLSTVQLLHNTIFHNNGSFLITSPLWMYHQPKTS
jgi:Zinc knuckle